jgi:hypothetical protein
MQEDAEDERCVASVAYAAMVTSGLLISYLFI